jgi:hypothetical protein
MRCGPLQPVGGRRASSARSRRRPGRESLIFVADGFRCPLTQIAEHLGAERGHFSDIYLPDWFAQNLPGIHVPLIALAAFLHARNLRAGRGC